MKKYLYILKSEIMTNLQYTFDILTEFISYCIFIFIFLNLWNYIYSNPNELINGYNMNQMIWYVSITEILYLSVRGRKLCRKICDDVRGGNIAYNINKPYNYVEYALFSHLGLVTIRFILLGTLGMLLGFIFLKSFPSITIIEFLGVILSSIFAIIINSLLTIFIGLISFFIEDANPFYWIYSKFILVLGTVFPIEFFPKIMQPFIKFSPIYVVSYGPAKLFVNFDNIQFINIIIAQIIYIILVLVICHLIYKKGVRKLNVNGG